MFTPTELKIVGHVWDGLIYKQIAVKMFRSQKTVEAHIQRMYKKFNVNNRVSLCRFALKVGVIEL